MESNESHDVRPAKPILNPGDHKCFGCGPQNPLGLQMQFFTDELSVWSQVTIPTHMCGWDNLAHGGIITTMLDEIMSWSAIYLLKKIILTKSIAVDFLVPVRVGDQVKVEGRIYKKENERQAQVQGVLYGADGKVCSRSTGTFALIDEAFARKKGLMLRCGPEIVSDHYSILMILWCGLGRLTCPGCRGRFMAAVKAAVIRCERYAGEQEVAA